MWLNIMGNEITSSYHQNCMHIFVNIQALFVYTVVSNKNVTFLDSLHTRLDELGSTRVFVSVLGVGINYHSNLRTAKNK